jgi:hypothetical protein
MVCDKCGYNNAEGLTFCVNCGNQLVVNNQVQQPQQAPVEQPVQQQVPTQQSVGSITIIRPDNFAGCLVPYSVFVDGYFMGEVSNNSQATFQLYYGSHLVKIECGMGSGVQQIIINDSQKNLVFQCPMSMGLVQNTIYFNLISVY